MCWKEIKKEINSKEVIKEQEKKAYLLFLPYLIYLSLKVLFVIFGCLNFFIKLESPNYFDDFIWWLT